MAWLVSGADVGKGIWIEGHTGRWVECTCPRGESRVGLRGPTWWRL
jgi:hypothetical protein